jgi:hypothetical protein
MKGKLIWSIFWALVAVFVIVVGGMFTTPLNLPPGIRPILFPTSWALFLLLGITLLVLTLREKIGGMLKKFFLLTGASAVGVFASILLHGVVYALFILCFGEDFWTRSGLGDEPFFFILATMVCPLAFLVGAIGSIVLFIKKPWLVKKSPSRRR